MFKNFTWAKFKTWLVTVLLPIICAQIGGDQLQNQIAGSKPASYEATDTTYNEKVFKTYLVYVIEKIPVKGIAGLDSFTKSYVFKTVKEKQPDEKFIFETVQKLGAKGEIQLASITLLETGELNKE